MVWVRIKVIVSEVKGDFEGKEGIECSGWGLGRRSLESERPFGREIVAHLHRLGVRQCMVEHHHLHQSTHPIKS